MKKEYRNKIRSKMLIREAVIELLEKKGDISAVTVSDVVQLANINRGTFYNHYNNVVEVLEELKDEKMQIFLDELKRIATFEDFEMFANNIIAYFSDNKESFKKIIKGISRTMIDDLKLEFVKEVKKIRPNIDTFNLTFIANALAGMYIDYLQDRSEFTLQEMGSRVIDIVKKYHEREFGCK
jgi:AcrR family transcriptional regulator